LSCWVKREIDHYCMPEWLSSIKQDKFQGGRNLKTPHYMKCCWPYSWQKEPTIVFPANYTTCIIADLERTQFESHPLCGAGQNQKITSRDPSDQPNIQAITKGRDSNPPARHAHFSLNPKPFSLCIPDLIANPSH
jgi:hypothetical protein